MGGAICHLMTILESPVKQKTENCVSPDLPKLEDSGCVPETCVNLIFGARGGCSLYIKAFPAWSQIEPSMPSHTCDFPPVSLKTQLTCASFNPVTHDEIERLGFCFRIF